MPADSTPRIIVFVLLAIFVAVLKKPKRTYPKTATVLGKTMRLNKSTAIVGSIFAALGVASIIF